MAVVCHHAFRAVTINKPAGLVLPRPLLLSHPILIELGAFGVDIFFVLSGFLMIYISEPYVLRRRPISDFLAHRWIRVWPLYALVTAVICVKLLLQYRTTHVLPFDLRPDRLLSFFFIPSYDPHGAVAPILGVGWTLNYEAYFYVSFAAALLVARRHMLLALMMIITTLYCIGLALPSRTVAGVFLSDAVVFEFILGAAIATAWLRRRRPVRRPMVWLVGGVAMLAAFAQFPAEDGYRFGTRGLAAGAIFIGMVGLEGRVTWPRALLRLGDASYSLYLVHILVIYAIAPIGLRIAVHHGLSAGVAEGVAACSIAASVVAGLLCYRLVERPLLKTGQKLYRRTRMAGVPAPDPA